MMPQSMDLAALMARLEKLEQHKETLRSQSGWLKGAVTLLLVITGGMLLVAAQARTLPKTVEAEKFILRHGNGKQRAELAIRKTGASLRLVGPDGRPLFCKP